MTFQLEMTEPEKKEIEFGEFWQKWPRKESKPDAKRVWLKLSQTKRLAIMNDILSRYEGIEKRFIPYPATYLRGERWEDDPIPREEEKPTGPTSFHPSHKEFKRDDKPKTAPDMSLNFTLKGLTCK